MPYLYFFFFNDTATTEIYTLSLHDALPIWGQAVVVVLDLEARRSVTISYQLSANPKLSEIRSEEHTSELQSPCNLVCRLLLEKKKPQPSKGLPADTSTRLRTFSSGAQCDTI